MLIFQDRPDSIAELHREMNALCGLVQFARERCYPEALRSHLEMLLEQSMAEATRRQQGLVAAA